MIRYMYGRAGLLDLSMPYDEGVIALVRGIQGRTWDPRRKMWSIPTGRRAELDAKCQALLREREAEWRSLLTGADDVPLDAGS